MRKNGFLEGAFITTLGIVIVKAIGVIYVIPFYAIVGDQGGALYGYAYNIYLIFLTVSSAGIPIAMSKIVSEYNSRDMNYIKWRVYSVGRRMTLIISIVSFLILFIFAGSIAQIYIGDAVGGNTTADVTFVIRVVATSILVVPFLSVSKGFLQGHKFMKPSSVSQVIEQLLRAGVIVLGSFAAINIFGLSLTGAVGVAVFGATAGGIGAYLYIRRNLNKNKALLDYGAIRVPEEHGITDKYLMKKILITAIPFIFVTLGRNIYNTIDIVMIGRTLRDILGFQTDASEAVISVFTTWGTKLNMIVLAVSTGLVTSIIPNIASSFAKKKLMDVNKKINQSIRLIFLVALPMVLGLSALAQPVWTLFYGSESDFGHIVFQVFVLSAFFASLFTVCISIAQALGRKKSVYISMTVGILTNIILNIPMMLLFNALGFEPYYGATLASIIGYIVTSLIVLKMLKNFIPVRFKNTVKIGIIISVTALMMWGAVKLMSLVLPFDTTNRMIALLVIAACAAVGGILYFLILYKLDIIARVISREQQDRILTKLKLKRKNKEC